MELTSGRVAAWAAIVAAAAVLPSGGCGGAAGKSASLAGQVTLDGAAIEDGAIQLDPLDNPNNTGAATRIQRGAYSLNAADGLRSGRYRVRITAVHSGAKENFLPPRFNSDSELEITVDPGDGRRDFPLESAP